MPLSGTAKKQDKKCDIWQISKVSQFNIKFSTLKSDLVDCFCEINIWHWQKWWFEFKANSGFQSP